MDSNGVSREGPPTPTDEEEDDFMRIRTAGSESPNIQDLRNTRQRGLSEAQQLLAESERNSFEGDDSNSFGQNSFAAEVTQAFRYVGVKPEVVGDAGRGGNDGVVNGYPQPLKSSRSLGKDSFMAIVALPLFGLAAGVIYFDEKVVTEYFENLLDNCVKVTATIFPIIFSMIVGRTMYKIASWKLERGSNVGLLEQLMGSRTFSSTVLTQFGLWTNPVLCVGLILLWVLSPVGSQAALRMLYTKTSPTTSPTAINYISTRQAINSENGTLSWFPGFATLFGASLLAPLEIKTGPMDLWHNVKIPVFSSLSNMPMKQDGWKSIPTNGFQPTYSSLFGIPISGTPSAVETTFTLESTYLELACTNKTTQRIREAGTENRNTTFTNPDLISTAGPFKSGQNITALTTWEIGYRGEDITSLLPSTDSTIQIPCLDCLSTSPAPDGAKYSGTILYQDFTGGENVTSIYCTPAQVYIESRILCTSLKNCTVVAQRESLLPHAPQSITLLSFFPAFLGLSQYLPNATHSSPTLDLLQNFLTKPLDNHFIQSNPMAYLSSSTTTSTSPNTNQNINKRESESHSLSLPLKDFSIRFSQVINAFWYGSMANSTQFLTGANFADMQTWENAPAPIPATSADEIYNAIKTSKPALSVVADTVTTSVVFALSIPWLTVYLFTVLIMFLSALVSLVLSHMLKTPGYLGYVSTLVRESGNVIDEERFMVGVQAGGLERAKGMKGVGVRLGDCGDLEHGWEVGTGVEVRVGRLGVGGVRLGDRGVESDGVGGEGEGETGGMRDLEGVRGVVGGKLYI